MMGQRPILINTGPQLVAWQRTLPRLQSGLGTAGRRRHVVKEMHFKGREAALRWKKMTHLADNVDTVYFLEAS